MRRRRPLAVPLLLSTLIHCIILIFLLRRGEDIFLNSGIQPEQAAKKPITFELVESPEQARTNEVQRETNLLSDKNARAQDMSNKDLPLGRLPSSEGELDIKTLPQAVGSYSVPQQAAAAAAANETEEAKADKGQGTEVAPPLPATSSRFSRDMLFGNQSGTPSPRYKQENEKAPARGGISFNTYNWEFAPYLLDLKHRIQKNISPPAAFTRLGLGGENIIRFRIQPDGRLDDIEVLGKHGEQALIETSRMAIKLSAPFPPLPKDFPEDFLQVTVHFVYYIQSN